MDGSLKVLLVEDDEKQANLMGDSLRQYDSRFEIETSVSENDCLTKLSEEHYEAVIVDFNTPSQDDLKILNRITGGCADTPIVVVSKHDDEQFVTNVLKNGANDCIVKDSSYLSVLPKVVKKIIEKHHLEIKLRDSERKYQTIFEKSNDAILIVNPQDCVILDLNFKTTEILGYSKRDLIGNKFIDLYPDTQKEKAQEVVAKTISAGVNNDDTLAMKASDGFLIPVDIHASVINFGEHDYILCNVRNIAEKKHLQTLILDSKKRLQNTFDGIKDPIYQVNKNFEIVIANKKFADQCHSQPEKLIGKKCYDVYSNCKQPCDSCPVERTFETNQPSFVEKSSGDEIYDIWSYPIYTSDGQLESVAVYSRDVTERKKLEKSLIQSEKLATIGLLASGIAHELRNPLNVIETARYYIEEFLSVKDPDISKKLEIIKKNVRRSSNIINNLLEFSRHSEDETEKIDLNKLIESTMSLIKKELDAKCIEFSLKSEGTLFAEFNIDSLKQVLLNMIINAIQAMPDGGKLVIYIVKGTTNHIKIHIADTGIGIPEKNLKHIFSPFFTTKEVGVGTGLGLYISHRIIEREGGKIEVQSEVNKGTTFTISLPGCEET